MGQYHAIYNLDRKESFSGLCCGAKLWEKASDINALALLVLMCNSNGRGGGDLIAEDGDKKHAAAIKKISGRWSGDRIVVQGDYAKPTDTSFIEKSDLSEFKSINKIVEDAMEPVFPAAIAAERRMMG